MAVTATQIQALIVLEVGETDSGTLAANMPTIWASYADKAAIAPRLQELYAKRRCIDIALGDVRQLVGFTSDTVTIKQGEKSANLAAMRTATQAEIDAIEKRARAGRVGAVGLITTVEPIAPPTSLPLPESRIPDAGDSRYQGSPYKPLRRV